MPLITLSHSATERAVFITTHRDLDRKLIDQIKRHPECFSSEKSIEGRIQHIALYIPDIERKKIWLYPWYVLTWLWAAIRLVKLSFRARPKKVVSTGGLCAVPVFLTAWLLKIPCELFELNAVPGDAVRILAPLSRTIFYCYKTAAQYLPENKIRYKPYPVRSFTTVTAYEARGALGLSPHKKTICFLGGSQGSHFINGLARKIVERFSPGDIQIVHQTGPADHQESAAWYAQRNYTAFVVDFYPEIETLYCAADFVICRAGAGTLWELEYMNIPTCIIPLETAATDHQKYNAQALCSQKPEQFTCLLQEYAEKNSDAIVSLFSREVPESRWHADHEDLSLQDPLFHE